MRGPSIYNKIKTSHAERYAHHIRFYFASGTHVEPSPAFVANPEILPRDHDVKRLWLADISDPLDENAIPRWKVANHRVPVTKESALKK